MPHIEEWPPELARLYRAAMTSLYLVVAVAGVVGLTWPRAGSIPDPLLFVLRFGGVFMTIPALVSLAAQLSERWRVELLTVWCINVGATLYISVVLLVAGPEREWVLFALFILATMLGVSLRGITLLVFERRTRKAKGGRRWGAES